MQNFTVYKYTSPKGKVYIGKTCRTPEKRAGKNGNGYKGQYFYRAIQKYGLENLICEIIADDLSNEEACDLERFLIWKYNTTNRDRGYNVTFGGDGSYGRTGENAPFYNGHHDDVTRAQISKNLKHTLSLPEEKKRMSERSKHSWENAEYRENRIKCLKNEWANPESREKRIEGLKRSWEDPFIRRKRIERIKACKKMNRNHPNYGKYLSEETRRKISEANKGKQGLNGEKNPFYGKKHTEETRKYLSKLKKGRTPWNKGLTVITKVSKSVICIETDDRYRSISEAYKNTGIQHIKEVCDGKRKTAGGYHWRYVDD